MSINNVRLIRRRDPIVLANHSCYCFVATPPALFNLGTGTILLCAAAKNMLPNLHTHEYILRILYMKKNIYMRGVESKCVNLNKTILIIQYEKM